MTLLLLAMLGPLSGRCQYWERTYGGFGSDQAADVLLRADGGFVIAGSTGSFGPGGGDLYVIGTDADGIPEWSRALGGAAVDQGQAVAQADGGFLVLGTTTSFGAGGYDLLAYRLDASGNVLWQRTYGSAEWDFGRDAVFLGDGWALAGRTFGASVQGHAWLLRTDLAGDTLWTRTWSDGRPSEAHAVLPLADGSLLVAGSTGAGDDQDGFVASFLPDGTPGWSLLLGGDSADVVLGMDTCTNGDVVVVGNTASWSVFQQILVARTTQAGTLIWSEHYGQLDEHEGHDVAGRSSDRIAIAGSTRGYGAGGSDGYLLLLDAAGQFEQGLTYGGPADDGLNTLVALPVGDFVLAGRTRSYGPGQEAVHALRTDSLGSTQGSPVQEGFDPLPVADRIAAPSFIVHPNPISAGQVLSFGETGNGAVRLELLDQGGRLVHGWRLVGPEPTWPNVAPGAYLLRMLGRNGTVLYARIIAY